MVRRVRVRSVVFGIAVLIVSLQVSMLRGSLWRGTLKRDTDGPKSDRLPPLYWAAFVLSTGCT